MTSKDIRSSNRRYWIREKKKKQIKKLMARGMSEEEAVQKLFHDLPPDFWIKSQSSGCLRYVLLILIAPIILLSLMFDFF